MLLRKILAIFVLFIFSSNYSFSLNIEIKTKIDNSIITNIDIENEIKYLVFLNPKLNELGKKEKINIAKNSLIREIIKEKELKKFFKIDKKYNFVDQIEKKLLLEKNLNKNELVEILNANNMDYFEFRKKLKMETLWNQLIYKKYIKNVKIDKKNLRKRIIDQFKNAEKKYEYNLSEIVFEQKVNESLETTIKQINRSIESIGFENTANSVSISNTSKNGGLIGWINELQISKKLKVKIKKLQINAISEPIKIPNGYLMIKLNDKKEFNQNIDIEKELEKLINYETNNQLNNFSIIFYKRLKQNIKVNEY